MKLDRTTVVFAINKMEELLVKLNFEKRVECSRYVVYGNGGNEIELWKDGEIFIGNNKHRDKLKG